MEQFQDKLQNIFMPVANKLNSFKALNGLKNAMMHIIPLSIIGGFAMLIASPPISPTMEATNFFSTMLLNWKTWATANAGILLTPYNLTIGGLALYLAFLVAYEYSKILELNPIQNGVTSLFIFLMTAAAPEATETGMFISTRNLGGEGMFYAILVGFAVTWIFAGFKKADIQIKMPEQVPQNVVAPFQALFPAVTATIVFLIANIICTNITGENLGRLIFTILVPLMRASSSLPSVIILSMLLSIFWFMGIHGNNIVGAVLTPITTANLAANADAILTGNTEALTPLAGHFMTVFGNWMSYPAMMLCFFLVAKSSYLKTIRKVAVVPDLFNINEPLTFGVPVMMNILIALPIMVCNVIMCSAAYLLMSSGVVGSMYISLPFTVPGVLYVFLATMDFNAVIMWVIMFIIDVIILLPFVKMYDKQMLAEEESTVVIPMDEAEAV